MTNKITPEIARKVVKTVMEAKDMINHPVHYNNSDARCECGRRIECIDITRHMIFNVGNIVKYLWRYQDKDGLIALKKARWYLQDLINQMEKNK